MRIGILLFAVALSGCASRAESPHRRELVAEVRKLVKLEDANMHVIPPAARARFRTESNFTLGDWHYFRDYFDQSMTRRKEVPDYGARYIPPNGEVGYNGAYTAIYGVWVLDDLDAEARDILEHYRDLIQERGMNPRAQGAGVIK